MTTVLDKGIVQLQNFMGGDLAVIASARISNGASYEKASKGPEKDTKLIQYLIKHRHGTPFEHSTFQFYVKAPLFVVREWQRHRMASYNEISGRYIEFEPEFYIPDKLRVAGVTNKQGSQIPTEQWVEQLFLDREGAIPYQPLSSWNNSSRTVIEKASKQAYMSYKHLIEDKRVAKEMARMVLPLNLYSQFYWTVNARSLMNFVGLRNAPDAQWEIQQYAKAIEEFFKEKMPITYEAFIDNHRITP